MTSVLLVDDHRLLRESLRRTLEESGLEVAGEAANGNEAVRMAGELQPDVVLMDVSMPVLDGVEATRLIRRQSPDVRVVMLTMHAEDEVLTRAVRAGAAGYLVKDCSAQDILDAVTRVCSGGTTLSIDVASAMLAEATRVSPTPDGQDVRSGSGPIITRREEEVLQLIAEGFSTSEVGQRLFISAKTVKNHLASVYEKLDSRDRTQAVVRAVRMGIIRLD
ncbi:MAG TPA: response regulator transcription factor [Acidimicrobiales bacterium]